MVDVPLATHNRRRSPVSTRAQSTVVGQLKQLLACIDEESASTSLAPQQEVSTEEVVLEVQVDDVRYILTRTCVEPPSSGVSLSPREQEVVRLVAQGHPNKVIAKVLDISPWTVSTHLRRVFTKLRVSSRAEMVARVLNEDML